MALFKRRAPEVPPDLAALQGREQELSARQRALEARHLESSDIIEGAQLLEEINDLNARLGVLRGQIEEFPK